MPRRNARPCNTPGCPGLTTVRFCLRCRTKRRQLRQDETAPYDTKQWRSCAKAFLRAHPGCAVLNCSWPATEVHHIDGQGPNGPRGRDWTNLRALCKSHHSQITGATVGFGRRHE